MQVYGIIDPRSGALRYVGKTVQSLDVRLSQHIYGAQTQFRRHTRTRSLIKNLLAQGLKPEIIVLETADSELKLAELERFWIASIRAAGADLLNHTDGGEGQRGLIHTPEAKARLSLANKGRRLSQNSTAMKAAWARGVFDKVKRRPRLLNENIRRSRALGGRPVLAKIVGSESWQRFETTRGCGRALNLDQANIVRCLKGRQPRHKGFVFKYAE